MASPADPQALARALLGLPSIVPQVPPPIPMPPPSSLWDKQRGGDLMMSWDSLRQVIPMMENWNVSWRGRPESTNIEDRRIQGRQSAFTGPGVSYSDPEQGSAGQQALAAYQEAQRQRAIANLKPMHFNTNHHMRPVKLPDWLK